MDQNDRASLGASYATAAALRRLQAEIPWVAEHGVRVGILAADFAASIGRSEFECNLLRVSGALHDAGKMYVPRYLIDKPGELTEAEMEQVRYHAVLSSTVVLDAVDMLPPYHLGEKPGSVGSEDERRVLSAILALNAESLTRVARLCCEHHERCDGTGYPRGLTVKQCDPLQPMLVLADTYDSITNVRPYRTHAHPREALAEIHRWIDTQFDREYALAFIRFMRRRLEIDERVPVAISA